jgi:hypothetical protein
MRMITTMVCALALAVSGAAAADPKGEAHHDKFPNLHKAVWNLKEAHKAIEKAEPSWTKAGEGAQIKAIAAEIMAADKEAHDALKFAEKNTKESQAAPAKHEVKLNNTIDEKRHINLHTAQQHLDRAYYVMELAVEWHKSRGTLGGHGSKCLELTKAAHDKIAQLAAAFDAKHPAK